VTVAPGDAAYVCISGTGNIGRFTNASGADAVAINARFATVADENGIAELDVLDTFAPAP
jgi:ApbE superfamily uncharacterized protein (UPF0280 family)